MEQQTQPARAQRLKVTIIVLAVLLVLSAGGLAARYLYLYFTAPAQATTAVLDSLIGEEPENSSEKIPGASDGVENPPVTASDSEENESDLSSSDNGESGTTGDTSGVVGNENSSSIADKPCAQVLELYAGRSDANQKFEITNMLPGDSVTKYFCIRAYHDADINLFFKTDVTEQTKSLGNILHIKVTHLDTGKVLCDAPFSEVDGQEFSELLAKNTQGETTAYYQIDVSLDTSVGNEYQAARLLTDFLWYVEDKGGLTPPPQTGDNFNLTLWVVLAASSLLLILLLLLGRRRKEALYG